jgi:hypothetical protein
LSLINKRAIAGCLKKDLFTGKESLQNYIQEISCLLKDYARQAKAEADHPKEGVKQKNLV